MSAMYASIGSDMLASSASLLMTRVAAAAARVRLGSALTASDADALNNVLNALRSEISVLRGEREPDVRDESAYAVAGFALGEISATGGATSSPDETSAARSLEGLAETLENLLLGRSTQGEQELLEHVFLSTGRQASLGLSGTGEYLPGPSLVFA